MSRCYAIDGTRAVASPTKTVLGLVATTAIRPLIYFMVFGASGTPADNALQWLIQRFTAAGTSTAVTPEPLDNAAGQPAASATAGENHTVEPTYTAGDVLLNVPLNQRATYNWQAREGRELKLPAVAANGIGVQPVHASYTGNVETTIHYEE